MAKLKLDPFLANNPMSAKFLTMDERIAAVERVRDNQVSHARALYSERIS
jgi:hypothetical protein